jgi:hypothetical protein
MAGDDQTRPPPGSSLSRPARRLADKGRALLNRRKLSPSPTVHDAVMHSFEPEWLVSLLNYRFCGLQEYKMKNLLVRN